MAEDLEYNLSIEYKKFLEGSRKSKAALVDLDKFAKKTDQTFNDLYNSGVSLGKGMTKTATAVKRATTQFKTMKGATAQLSYQIQDVAVQAQMGTSAFTILAQQGPQIASVFGPGGAVIGAIVALAAAFGGTLFSALSDTSDSVDEMIEKMDKLGTAQKELLKVKLADKMTETADAVNEAYAKVSALTSELNKQKDALKAMQEGTGSGMLDSFKWAQSGVESKIKNISSSLIEAKANLESVSDEYDKYKNAMDRVTSGSTDMQGKIKDSQEAFDDLSKSLQLQITMIGKSAKEQAKLTAAAQLGEAATKAQKDAVNVLIDTYYDELDAYEKNNAAQKERDAAQQKTAKLLSSLSDAYDVAALKAKGLNKQAYILAQRQKLGADATKEQIAQLEKLAAATYDAQNAASGSSSVSDSDSSDFLSALKENYDKQQALVEQYTEAGLEYDDAIHKTKLELIDSQEQEKLDKLEEYWSARQITAQEYQDAQTQIEQDASNARIQLAEAEAEAKRSVYKGIFSDLATLMDTGSRKMFEVGKVASIANATISGYEAAVSAWAMGMKTGGPVLAAAYTAASLIKTGALIQQIASTSYGSSSSSSVSSSSDTSSSSSSTTSTLQIEVVGTSTDALTDAIIDIINNAQNNGNNVTVS